MKEGERNMTEEDKMTILNGESVQISGYRKPMGLSNRYFLSDEYQYGSHNQAVTLADGTKLYPQEHTGYYALQDKETNELHCISLYPYTGYHNTFKISESVKYFDTSVMKGYISQTWTAYSIGYIKHALKTRFRKNLGDYNLVVIELSDKLRSLPYFTGNCGNYTVNYMGPSPLSRTQLNCVKQIYVLTENIEGISNNVEVENKVKEIKIEVV